jgi:putative spermidine/putrescine transport system ATP-binding protein
VLRLEALSKTYPGFSLRVSLALESGLTLGLLGPSGSGKSTLLRLVAGLESPDSGSVSLGQTELTHLSPERRNIGMVFQDYALFPHLSVWENIAFGPKEARWERARVASRVEELLELTGLTPQAKKRPEQLSGGEQQRVALARALANRPQLLLLDEPLGALDRGLREELLMDLRHILRSTHTTAIAVTHDQEEAYKLAHLVAVMQAGRVVQVDTPEQLYRQPANLWVAQFLGHRNVLGAEQSAALGLAAGSYLIPQSAIKLGAGTITAVVGERIFMGERVGLWLDWRGQRLYWEGPDPGLAEGQELGLAVDLSQARVLEERTEKWEPGTEVRAP